MRKRKNGRAGWIRKWDEERREAVLDEWREEGTGLNGWWSGVRERRRGRVGWMEEWGEGEKREQG